MTHDGHGHDGHGHDGHGHDGHGHDGHGALAAAAPADGRGARYLLGALALILAFMAAEVTVGLLAHSLALISDAAHMLADAAAIALALTVMRLSARPPGGGYTYGLRRTEILSAQANGITLLLLAAWLTYEAVRRLITAPAVHGGPVLAVALAGIVVNVLAAALTSRADRTSLNIEGAFRHIVTDAYAFIATAIAGIVMITTGFGRADAIASLVVVALMARAGAGLLRESGRIFLEAAPPGLSPDAIGQAMAARTGVAEVHDLHIWQITSGMPAASAHVLVGPGQDCHAVRVDLEHLLAGTYQIGHTTLQVDHAPSPWLTIRDTPPPPANGSPANGLPGTGPAGDSPAGDSPAGDSPAGDSPAGDSPAGDSPAGDSPAGDSPAGDDTSGHGAPGDVSPSYGTPGYSHCPQAHGPAHRPAR